MPKLLLPAFYQQPALTLAPALLGCTLIREVDGQLRRAQLTETEAYVGSHDLACHAAKGRTARTEVMFAPGGITYVYLIYGMYHMLNIVASTLDDPQAVLIRGAIPLDNWKVDLTGPGKLARAFGLTREHNGMFLEPPHLHVLASAEGLVQHVTTPRIGVDYAKEWKDAPLRFIDPRYVKR
ncbi:MAG: DNA-3-methyladenine glycosylase [Gemmatales bacterium]